jgi:hypothetical protein
VVTHLRYVYVEHTRKPCNVLVTAALSCQVCCAVNTLLNGCAWYGTLGLSPLRTTLPVLGTFLVQVMGDVVPKTIPRLPYPICIVYT